jgi:crotonobetainyl-CoA:carnitine CoA-transferase CaiB-like acyl-CoA transferase
VAPLDGLTVIDLSRVVAGPFCTMLLGDMGADVIKIEEPDHGDDSRGWAPAFDGWSSYFLGLNRNKRSLALDVKTAEGHRVLHTLLETADVFVENFRPGGLSKLGFGYDDMHRVNPRLIYCSISGYGHTGPKRALAGYDVVVQGEAGLMSVTGPKEGPPMRVGIAITDHLAGLYANQGILLALIERGRTGKGQHIDIALLDSMVSVMTLPAGILFATGHTAHQMGNEHPSITPYELFAVRDGSLIVAAGNERLWRQLCDAISRPDLAGDPRFVTNVDRLENRAALKAELDTVFRRYTRQELTALMQAHHVPCGPVRDIAEALADPQLHARGMVLDMLDPRGDPIRTLGNPIRLSDTPWSVRRAPPRLGEHTDEIVNALHYADAVETAD